MVLMNFVERALQRIARRFSSRTITGVDGSPYLTKHTLVDFGKDRGRLYLHEFHRGDEDEEHHDHPWNAVSFVLSGGYREERLGEDGKVVVLVRRPGAFNLIRTSTRHRVELIGKKAWTLFATGPVRRSWGFYDVHTGAYTPWRTFVARREAVRRKAEARES